MNAFEEITSISLAVCFVSCLVCICYSLRLQFSAKDAGYSAFLLAGTVVFFLANLHSITEFFFHIDSLSQTSELHIWLIGLASTVAAVLMQNARHRVTRFFTLSPNGFIISVEKLFFAGLVILTFIVLPTKLYAALTGTFQIGTISAAYLIGSGLGYSCLAGGAWMLHKGFSLGLEEGAEERHVFVNQDARVPRILTNLTNRFLKNIHHRLGRRTINGILADLFDNNPMIFEGCSLKLSGVVDFEELIANVARINKDDRMRVLYRTFKRLNSRLAEECSKVTSPNFVNRVLRESYVFARDRYGWVSGFSDVFGSIPNGFLEEERLALLTKNELEERIKERTKDLEELSEKLKKQNELLETEITQRGKTEKALRQSEERYRTLVENLPLGIYRTDAEGSLQMANPAFLKMFGFDPQHNIESITVSELYRTPEVGKEIIDTLLARGSLSETELALKQNDGTPIWGSINAKAIRSEQGEVVWFDCSVLDITGRKEAEEEKAKLEEQLRHVQKMKAVGTLAGGIAHDFNNLLMGIQGNASLLLLDIDPASQHHEKLKCIEDLVQSGSKLTAQLLGFARKGKYEVSPVDLNELILRTAETFARTRKEIVIRRNLDQNLSFVKADKGQMEQVLFNLYINAADAMPNGGELSLRTGNADHADLTGKPYTMKPGNYVILTVTDTGIGMDEKTIERIFEPFFTTKEMGRGTGLGLASVYGIVKAHGGYIDVDSVTGEGTTFSIYLPSTEAGIRKVARSEEEAVTGSGTILLVDDEDIILDVGVKLLGTLGYEVLAAKSGEEALRIYQSRKSEIILVILDMIMPHMGGRETYVRLKGVDPDVKILLSSGYSVDDQASTILEKGCDGFIQKPYNVKQLSVEISKVLR